ncbi:hypothetical protein [Dysgonomonas sp. Marseille-P4361]|uniref:hypothetical protein n=1 Tax=Dysgonomonas sp. Marseille-P4361 TaxID=2161820 RepID=UPI000D55A807|nr:hypothetical protein [Dysgonomonas sp. Marseille-P4361]
MSILYFNPGHETAVLNASKYYTAPANVVAMQRELSFLPAWYGSSNDVVLVESLTEYEDFYPAISKQFPLLPKPIDATSIRDYKNEEVVLWGISPQAIHYMRSICDTSCIIPDWERECLLLHSRETAKECLIKLIDTVEGISKSIIPQFHTQLETIEETVNISSSQLLAKAPYSSSGRGLLWLHQTGITRTEKQILHGILKKQGAVSVEQVLEKDMDFAMEFIVDNQGDISFEGYSLFFTNAKGSYLGNYLMSQKEIIAQLTCKISSGVLLQVQEKLTLILKEKYAPVYKGCIGVDMMLYKENGEYKLHPCLEINMRYNMGYLATKLYERYVDPTSKGMFKIDFSAKSGDIFTRHQENINNHPLSLEGGRIQKGYLPLCPVTEDSHYWAYILIEN